MHRYKRQTITYRFGLCCEFGPRCGAEPQSESYIYTTALTIYYATATKVFSDIYCVYPVCPYTSLSGELLFLHESFYIWYTTLPSRGRVRNVHIFADSPMHPELWLFFHWCVHSYTPSATVAFCFTNTFLVYYIRYRMYPEKPGDQIIKQKGRGRGR